MGNSTEQAVVKALGLPGRLAEGRAFLLTHWPLLLLLALAFWLRQQQMLLNAVDWDESNTLAISRMGLKDMVWFSYFHEIHPPGWNLLLRGWTALFGATDWSLRLCSVLWGTAAVGMGYWLSFRLSASRWTAAMTAFFLALMPLGIRYSHFATAPSANFALVLLSWVLLLRVLSLPAGANPYRHAVFWCYGLVSCWVTQLYASGPYFLVFQGLYFLCCGGRSDRRVWRALLALGVGILVLNIPHAWVLSQPWHLSRQAFQNLMHPLASPSFFLLSPLAFLFYSFDLRTDSNDLKLLPVWSQAVQYMAVVYPILLWGFYRLFQRHQSAFWVVWFACVLPWLCAYLLGFAGLHLFNFRSMLYAGFGFYFTLATLAGDWLASGRKFWAACLVLGVLLMQLALPANEKQFWSIDWRVYAGHLKKLIRPGDGLLVHTGNMSLPLLRYYRPQDFGYTRQVIDGLPWRGENALTRVERIDQRYFFVNGDAFTRPDVQRAFQRFQKQHRRLILVIFHVPWAMLPLVDCHQEIWVVEPRGPRRLTCQSRWGG